MSKIIAHRGACKVAPENTIPAFQKAIEDGADGFECDVHLTVDGHVVVCHNDTIDATSNGKGKISELTLEQLRQFDFGSYFSEEFAGTKIPTLEEFLDVAKDLEIINIEIKSPENRSMELVRKTVDAVRKSKLICSTIISSFDDEILIESKKLNPCIKTGILYLPDMPIAEKMGDDYVGFAKKIDADALHPYVMFMEEDYIENCHKNGLMVNAWGVNSDFSIQTLNAAGVDGIITDYTDKAYSLIRKK